MKTYEIRVSTFGSDRFVRSDPPRAATKVWTVSGLREHAEGQAQAYARTQRNIGRDVTGISVEEVP